MNHQVIITCALAGDTVGKNPHMPATPEQIAAAAVEAARAGATVGHCHLHGPNARDPTAWYLHAALHFQALRDILDRDEPGYSPG